MKPPKFQVGQLVHVIDRWGEVEFLAIVERVCRPYTADHYTLVGHPVVYYTDKFLREAQIRYETA